MDRLRTLFDQHPDPASGAGELADRLVRATQECEAVCAACADACLAEDADMSLCIRNCLACAEVCGVVARVFSRPGRHDEEILSALLDACAAICRRCAAECEHHAGRMAHCGTCADVCRTCADACEAMAGALVPA